jgi:hypothetical protein
MLLYDDNAGRTAVRAPRAASLSCDQLNATWLLLSPASVALSTLRDRCFDAAVPDEAKPRRRWVDNSKLATGALAPALRETGAVEDGEVLDDRDVAGRQLAGVSRAATRT